LLTRRFHRRQNAAHLHQGLVGDIAVKYCRDSGIDLSRQQMRDSVERMSGHVQAQHLALQCEFVLVVPLLVGNLDGEYRVSTCSPIIRVTTEQVELPHRLSLLGAQHRVDRVGVHQEQPLARMA